MQRFSLTILVVTLVIAIIGICTQRGHATTATYLSLVPLGLYVLYGIVGLLVAALRKRAASKDSTLLSVVLLSLPGLALSDRAAQVVAVVCVVYLIGLWAVLTARTSKVGENWQAPTWYRNNRFSLVPNLEWREGNEHNTNGFNFNWLFLRLWALDAVGFELAVVVESHFGIGLIGILPYLRWTLTIPVPERVGQWMQENTWRRPKPVAPAAENAPWFLKRVN